MTLLPTHRPPTHPGEMLLEEFLKPLGMRRAAFARAIGVPVRRLNELVTGRRSVTADTALRLERVLEMTASFWLNLQQDWDLWQVKHSDAGQAIASLRRVRRRVRRIRRLTKAAKSPRLSTTQS